ncbi:MULTISPECIES: L-arabinose isomerase [Paenibacillus]|uniref:L-arabinose isomerase n=1 Tax=Paenibacillus illinoisensis TaxID=59845 RepID=A0ABW8HQR2_9BACL|nr:MULTISPECIES: L-arabinose isomerase [Paenibacillus]MCL6662007.1 L-arabinose isomerase [Paenibacillus amylolyticus]MEC0125510.1 L-arabinose isomerase [Paenibacillus pabuli]
MLHAKPYVFWFVTGSQGLYGDDVLSKVESNSKKMIAELNHEANLPYSIQFKEVVTTPEAIRRVCLEANSSENCAGILTWMHTFSPAKMWISGLNQLRKPLLHLHTQYNVDIPWDSIDMEFMNLNQAAHGDREFGFIGARLGTARKIIAGHWKDEEVRTRIGAWMKTSAGYTESQTMKIARFGDNMRYVAVTEGDKVEGQIKFGWTINGYPAGDLAERVKEVSEAKVRELMDEYTELYDFTDNGRIEGAEREAIHEQARMEIALTEFLNEGGYTAFVTSFQDLHGLKQLPGLAAQRLMAAGYGFGGEGDWKTAALVRMMKMMADNKGTSFMEDYTYHLQKGNAMVLGSHMLEICPTLAADRPRIEVHPLFVGGKGDPARLIFNGASGKGVNATVVDMGDRFRLIVNEVNAVQNEKRMPHLPVASLLWKPEPSLTKAAEAWILAGGAHHFGFSFHVTSEQLKDWARMAGIECLVINTSTTLDSLENEIRWNDLYYRLNH